jgi:hypothetical protein
MTPLSAAKSGLSVATACQHADGKPTGLGCELTALEHF